MGFIGSAISARVNWKIAKRQMEFQERMSNTAFQRQMADLKDAGLNPMLAKNMGGATTPPGAAIPVDFNQAEDQAIKSVGEYQKGRLTKKQRATEGARKLLVDQQAALGAAQTGLALANTGTAVATARNQNAQADRQTLETQVIGTGLHQKKTQEEFDKSGFGEFMTKVHRSGFKLPLIMDSRSSAKSIRNITK